MTNIVAYFDASGTWSDPKCTHITLAGFSAAENDWAKFENGWESALASHGAPITDTGKRYWHSFKAFNLKKEYAGWNEGRVRNLALDLFKVLENMPLDTLDGFAATINKSDFEKAKLVNSKMMTPEVLCLEHCLAKVVGRIQHAGGNQSLELVFDENEPFEGIVKDCVKKGIWWSEFVAGRVRHERACNSYPLQLCDFLAWMLNRYHSTRLDAVNKWNELAPIFTMTVPLWHVLYDSRSIPIAVKPNGSYDFSSLETTALGCDAHNLQKWQEIIWGYKFD